MKKVISILLVLAMILPVMPVYSEEGINDLTEAPLYGTETLIEFENGFIQGAGVKKATGVSASGGVALVFGGEKIVNVPPETIPDASFKINIPADGTYYIYMRYHSSNTSNDSIHFMWDRETTERNYSERGTSITEEGWGWIAIMSKDLTAGIHTLDFLRRESGIIVDAFAVTADYKSFDKDAEEERITLEGNKINSPQFALDSVATTFNVVNGYRVFEAEELVKGSDYNEKIYTLYEDSEEEGIVGIHSISGTGSGGDLPAADAKGLEFNFVSDNNSSVYVIWARLKVPGGGADSSYISIDGAKYSGAGGFGATEMIDNKYQYEWRKIGKVGNVYNGSKHNVRLYPREHRHTFDKFVITDNSLQMPGGENGEMMPVVLSATKYPAPTITPPPSHPRVYFTAADIPKIKENMLKEQNEVSYRSYLSYLEEYNTSFSGKLKSIMLDSYTNYSSRTCAVIEAFAFKYAIDGDENYGKRAIQCLKNMLNTATWDPQGQDVTRPIGHTVFIASQVYDWCYDLLTEEDKKYIIEKCEVTASLMEVGYPPSGQGAVSGHGGEAQLLRDLLGFGIATYDERPDIYNYVAGRLLSQFIKPRNFWYASSSHHQGSSYGSYRFFWELMFEETMYRMTGGDTNGGLRMFNNDTMSQVPYFFIYTRRPDGQVFRTGDASDGGELYSYRNSFVDTMFYSGNYFKDPILKGEYNIENPLDNHNNGNGSRSPVQHILFNDPDIEGDTDKTSLPLTKYFGSPSGMMIARTGWDVNPENPGEVDDVIAMMKIGERWGANHHHLDAGNFQLYYKGILASESGYYESYGTLHDQNYNKASIAHNVITVYNPEERLGSVRNSYTDREGNEIRLTDIFPYGVNDGGQRRGGGEASSWEIWNGSAGANYDTGVVLDHAFGPDEMAPEFTYIKGDITEAYSSEVAGSAERDIKVEKVMRAMAFMPLEDENYPAIMVVLDKVTSTNPDFKKKWLLHMQHEPEVDEENGVSIIKNTSGGNNGKLTVQTLLPKNAEITKVGGDGKKFWIGRQDANSNFETDGYNFDTIEDIELGGANEAGWGRIEVSPPTASKEDTFFNVLAVSDADNEAQPLESELIEGDNLIGVKTGGKVLMFSDVETSIADKNRVLESASFEVPGTERNLDLMIAGMKSGVWCVTNGGRTRKVVADEDGGVLYFEGGAGEYTLEYYGENKFKAQIGEVSAQKNEDNYDVSVLTEGCEGSKVIVALVGSNGRIVAAKNVSVPADGICRFEFSDEEVSRAVDVKIYAWDSLQMMRPIAISKILGANNLFK